LAKGQSRDHEETPGPHVGRVQAPRDRKIVKLHAADHPRTVEFYEQTFKRALSFKPLAKANLRDIDEELIARPIAADLWQYTKSQCNPIHEREGRVYGGRAG
jgi:hypothetical protein